jgi:hypothetical protein
MRAAKILLLVALLPAVASASPVGDWKSIVFSASVARVASEQQRFHGPYMIPAPLLFPRIAAASHGSLERATLVIDTDEMLSTPVVHQFIHGQLNGAEFQLCVPVSWNVKLLENEFP